jgi:hypothetical protein
VEEVREESRVERAGSCDARRAKGKQRVSA